MTNQEKAQAYFMRLEGATYQEIADHFGVKKQCIHQIIPGIQSFAERAANLCIYPNLSKWLRENESSFASLAKRANLGLV